MPIKNPDDKTIAKKTIMNSLKIEDSIANLLKTETKLLKKKSNTDLTLDEIIKINKLIKYLIYYLMLIDDRIQDSFNIIKNNKDNQ
jgi:hypothetical protein